MQYISSLAPKPPVVRMTALALMVRVAEGFMWAILSENCMGLYLGGYMTLSSCSSRLGPVCKLVDMREVERAFFL